VEIVFVRACALAQLEEGRPLGVEIQGLRIALVRQGETVHALASRCPHSGGPLDLGWIEDHELVCPLHHWRFRPRDGRCTTVRGEWVSTFPCELRGDDVWVAV
jgi:nitrite reductase/ring-hydroxylating ferredoxin subunit